MIIKNLGGHSGCKILLCEDNGVYSVKKISSSIEYNHRLESQCFKQKDFRSNSVKAPKVLTYGYIDSLFYFDMEYIQGITLAKYISKIDVSRISSIASIIIDNIDFENNTTDVAIFKDKVSNLKSKVSFLKNNDVNEAISYLENYDWSDFSHSECHGDLTLENIIVKNDELYFIDFLDSFYNSWVIDVGKILQDVECHWSYRNDNNLDTNTQLRLIIFKELIIDKLNQIDKKYVKDAYTALLLHLVRIYPYTKDDLTMTYLNNEVRHVLNIIRGGYL